MTEGRPPTQKFSRRGRLIFGWSAGGILALTLSLHFWFFPRFGKPPSVAQPLSAEGRIVGKDTLRDPDGRIVIRIIYRFRTAGGTTIEGRTSVAGQRPKDIGPGDKVRVLYSELDPRRNHIDWTKAGTGGPTAGPGSD